MYSRNKRRAASISAAVPACLILIRITSYNVCYTKLLRSAVVLVTGFLYYKLTGILFFENNHVLDTTRPLLALIFTFLASYTVSYYKEKKSKKFIKATLGKYVPEIVSKELLKDPEKFRP